MSCGSKIKPKLINFNIMIDNHKVLQAFWIMFNSTKEKQRSTLIFGDKILIYANKDEGIGPIGKIQVTTRTIEEETKWWLKPKEKVITYINGYVRHIPTGKRFYFNFSDQIDVPNEFNKQLVEEQVEKIVSLYKTSLKK